MHRSVAERLRMGSEFPKRSFCEGRCGFEPRQGNCAVVAQRRERLPGTEEIVSSSLTDGSTELVPVLKRRSCEATNLALEVRVLPGTLSLPC